MKNPSKGMLVADGRFNRVLPSERHTFRPSFPEDLFIYLLADIFIYLRGSYRKSRATIFCKVTCFIIDKPNTPP